MMVRSKLVRGFGWMGKILTRMPPLSCMMRMTFLRENYKEFIIESKKFMANKIKEIAAYCAANISDWEEKCQLALTQIGYRMPIDYGFRNEVEDCVHEWCDENEVAVDLFEGIDVEEIIMEG